ncbi:MAG: DNA mismatch repair protein MutS [Candidatus Riflebacteria bacterium HGW-Riflebacteria-1]|jgi:DNA-nicking Smr family endonuclease|nr:MAG: DNA mismatch repair protein MutS [Candidatus Riflebacteria bacterium HGW-Riflebacteria-1]
MTNLPPDPVELPLDGTLDLHTFQPREAAAVVADYLASCREKHIYSVRIVHGKGIGNLRRTVEAALARLEIVDSWQPAGHDAGHWGATLVKLKPRID